MSFEEFERKRPLLTHFRGAKNGLVGQNGLVNGLVDGLVNIAIWGNCVHGLGYRVYSNNEYSASDMV